MEEKLIKVLDLLDELLSMRCDFAWETQDIDDYQRQAAMHSVTILIKFYIENPDEMDDQIVKLTEDIKHMKKGNV